MAGSYGHPLQWVHFMTDRRISECEGTSGLTPELGDVLQPHFHTQACVTLGSAGHSRDEAVGGSAWEISQGRRCARQEPESELGSPTALRERGAQYQQCLLLCVSELP